MMGRVFTVLLMIISAFFALYLNNSLQAFGIILQIGAGTGLIFILRWFWYRINVYSELTAMTVSFLVALGFEFIFPNNFSVEEKLIIGVTITTICWLIATFITPPADIETLQNFYKKIQPGGPGWKKIIDISESNGFKIVGRKEKWDVPNGILCMVFGSISVYSILFGIGYILYAKTTTGLIFISISIISVLILMKFWRKLSS
jgi:Na+/proline symporter